MIIPFYGTMTNVSRRLGSLHGGKKLQHIEIDEKSKSETFVLFIENLWGHVKGYLVCKAFADRGQLYNIILHVVSELEEQHVRERSVADYSIQIALLIHVVFNDGRKLICEQERIRPVVWADWLLHLLDLDEHRY